MRALLETKKGDGPELQLWPLLVWFPDKGVCTEDHAVPIHLIKTTFRATANVRETASRCGTTPAHVNQAIAYWRSLGE